MPLSPSTPRAGGAQLAQADEPWGVVVVDDNVNISTKYVGVLGAVVPSGFGNVSC